MIFSAVPRENWTVLRDMVNSLAMDPLGPISRKHKVFFVENDEKQSMDLEEKLRKHNAYVCHTIIQ